VTVLLQHLSFRARWVRFNGGMINPTIRQCAAGLLALATLSISAGCSRTLKEPVSVKTTSSATAPATTRASSAKAGALFDGKTLTGWEVTDFAGHGPVTVVNGEVRVGLGHMTGITLTNTNDLPRMNYEVSLEAMRVDGSDFFCALTFPVGKDHCSFIVGGWGGGVVGLSNINSEDASQNETTKYMNFANNKWFRIRVRVVPGKIQAWIDDDAVVDVDTAEKTIGLRIETESCIPLGLATWNTAAAWKNIQVKKL
jgi:hypothetical protein